MPFDDDGVIELVRVAIFGGQELNRFGLRAALENQAGLQVLADEDFDQLATVIEEHRPDVVVADTVQPCRQACRVARSVHQRWPRVGVLIVANELCDCTHEVFGVGARGVVLKNVGPHDLVNAVRGVAAGYAIMPGDMVRKVCTAPEAIREPAADPRLGLLSERERQVLECLATGRSNAEIAQCLQLGAGTVKSHVQHLLTKLGLRDRVHAVIFAYRSGFVTVSTEGPPVGSALEACGPGAPVRSLAEARRAVTRVVTRGRTA